MARVFKINSSLATTYILPTPVKKRMQNNYAIPIPVKISQKSRLRVFPSINIDTINLQVAISVNIKNASPFGHTVISVNTMLGEK